MKQTDRVILEGLRKSVLADLPQVEWDMVVKAVVDAGDVRDVQGMARTIVFDAIEKASFASRSEAGRYAANQRWKGRMGRAGRAGSPPSGERSLNQVYMRWLDHEAPQTSAKDLVRMLDAKIITPDQLNDFDRNLVFNHRREQQGLKTGEFMDLTDIDPTGSMDKPATGEKKSPSTTEVDERTAKTIKEGDLSEIARLIEKDHRNSRKNLPFGAKPYVDALKSLEHVGQMYGADSGKSIVAYALSNLTSWKGPVARAVKAELKARLKAGVPKDAVDETQAAFDAWSRG